MSYWAGKQLAKAHNEATEEFGCFWGTLIILVLFFGIWGLFALCGYLLWLGAGKP